MSPNRKASWLLAGILTLLAGASARAQDVAPNDVQWFGPAENGSYGNGPDRKTGVFFGYEGLLWSINAPQPAYIGLAPPNSRPVWYDNTDTSMDIQTSTLNTGTFTSLVTPGSRFQYGYMGEEHGIIGETYWLQSQTQTIYATDVPMVVNDPIIGSFGERRLQGIIVHTPGVPVFPGQPSPPYIPANEVLRNLPITFATMNVQNVVDNWSTEVEYVRRFKPFHDGTELELLFGARYMEFNEEFDVSGVGGILANSNWSTLGNNHIIGPQIGGRLSHQWGNWILSGQGSFCPGLNIQNMQITGLLGSQLTPGVTQANIVLPLNYGPTAFINSATLTNFSPITEVRAEIAYQFTRTISARIGGNFIWVGGVARPSSMIDYSMPAFGLLTANNSQNVYIAGLNLGVEVNR